MAKRNLAFQYSLQVILGSSVGLLCQLGMLLAAGKRDQPAMA